MQSDAVVIVTGASRGMGAATAGWLARAGVGLALVARSPEALGNVAAEVERLGGNALTIVADVSDFTACQKIVTETLERYGQLDAVINNAGLLGPISRIGEAEPAAWRYNLEVNLLGPFFMAKASLGALRKRRGRIVNISSGAAHRAIVAWSAYCASKAALTHFTRVLAAEEPGLTVVALRPGVVDTEMQAQIRNGGSGEMTLSQMDYFRGLKQDGKLEPPEIPARVMAWLALEAPNSLSGEFLEYDDPRITEPALARFGEIEQEG